MRQLSSKPPTRSRGSYLKTVKYNNARATPGSTVSCSRYILHELAKELCKIFSRFLLSQWLSSVIIQIPLWQITLSSETETAISWLLDGVPTTLFWLLSLRAGIPLNTETRSQYCNQRDTIFQHARVTAEAFNDAKLMMKPETTGAKSLQVRSILLITEFIWVNVSGGLPSEITTTLKFKIPSQNFIQKILSLTEKMMFKAFICFWKWGDTIQK